MKARYGISLIVLSFITMLSASASAVIIQSSSMNIYNAISDEGPIGESPIGYGFEVFIWTDEDLGIVSPDEIALTVGGMVLPIRGVRIPEWLEEDQFCIIASGGFSEDGTTEPTIGDYEVSVRGSDSSYIGELQDIPNDAPEMLYPRHQQAISESTPAFEWEAFLSDYLTASMPSLGYEINLRFPDGSTVYTIYTDGEQTSVSYFATEWDPTPPEPLAPGVYNLTIHSNHSVASGFGFEHHRYIQFEVVPEPSTIMLLTTGLSSIAVYSFRRRKKT